MAFLLPWIMCPDRLLFADESIDALLRVRVLNVAGHGTTAALISSFQAHVPLLIEEGFAQSQNGPALLDERMDDVVSGSIQLIFGPVSGDEAGSEGLLSCHCFARQQHESGGFAAGRPADGDDWCQTADTPVHSRSRKSGTARSRHYVTRGHELDTRSDSGSTDFGDGGNGQVAQLDH